MKSEKCGIWKKQSLSSLLVSVRLYNSQICLLWFGILMFLNPALLAWCTKIGLAVREQVSPSDSLEFSLPFNVLYSTLHCNSFFC